MAVTRVEIRSRAPYEGGIPFGDVGTYERIDGTVHFAVDPAHEANQGIVDLVRAARDGGGRVPFLADFCILQPADPKRGSRRLLFEVPNRGRRGVVPNLNRAAPVLIPTERIDPGDGWLMRHGWTVAWCGWQWDVMRSPARMGMEAPQALAGGAPIEGRVLIRHQPNAPCRALPLTDRHVGDLGNHKPYPAADVNDPDATLTVRDYPDAPRTAIPRDRWRFARDEDARPVVDDTAVWLADGFEPGRIYEVVYRTRICPVVGAGLLSVRDFVALLKYGDTAAGNPCAGRIDHALGYGVSQCGRFLRHFLYLGLNMDEHGRQVFDGVLAHVAGARRGEFNHRYAQPSVQPTPSFGHLAPFADDEQTDPLTSRRDGLLRRQRARGGVPRIIYTNTSAEYWRGDASLLHTDLGGRDMELPAEVRAYLFAGTQHGAGLLPLISDSPFGTRGAHNFNTVSWIPPMRAALVNLDRWVSAGEEPPVSAVPRLADGTAVRVSDALAAFPTIPGTTLPQPEYLQPMRRLDLGPGAEQGVGKYPPVASEPYPTYVSAVDQDGNEVAGVRLPDVSVPVATYTGWNPRNPETGGAGQLLEYLGSTLPLPATAEERQRTGDPRPSIAERYGDRDGYAARVRAAAEELVNRQFILAEDLDLVVDNALARYDAFSARLVGTV